jgi:hypothetical protein
MRNATVAALTLLILACASSGGRAEAAVRRYLASTTLDQAMAALAPEYRLWFGRRSGDGISRETAGRMLQWDFALHPRHRIDGLSAERAEVVARVHEDNDFSLLIGFPGWDATSTFTLDANGRITSQLYVPREGQPEWRPYLDAPLAWLREHRAERLARVFIDGRLVQTAESAVEWVRLLREWRAATGQPDPTAH